MITSKITITNHGPQQNCHAPRTRSRSRTRTRCPCFPVYVNVYRCAVNVYGLAFPPFTFSFTYTYTTPPFHRVRERVRPRCESVGGRGCAFSAFFARSEVGSAGVPARTEKGRARFRCAVWRSMNTRPAFYTKRCCGRGRPRSRLRTAQDCGTAGVPTGRAVSPRPPPGRTHACFSPTLNAEG